MSYDEERELFKMQQDFRNAQGLNSVYVQPTTGSAIDKANDWFDYQNTKSTARNSSTSTTSVSSSTSSRRTTSRSNTSSSSSLTLSRSTTPTSSTVSSSSTTPSRSSTSSSSATSSLSSNTTSSNGANAVAGTSTTISAPADYSSSNTDGEDSIDYSSATETAVEPSIETPDESTYQAHEISEETSLTPEQSSGQYSYAPAEGAELWGSPENDTLIGGGGDDIFYGGKDQGSDTFLNVSSTDKVYLSDVTFNDLSEVKKENDMITFTFKNGNTVNIQSSDTISGEVILADSTWHFQHTPQA